LVLSDNAISVIKGNQVVMLMNIPELFPKPWTRSERRKSANHCRL